VSDASSALSTTVRFASRLFAGIVAVGAVALLVLSLWNTWRQPDPWFFSVPFWVLFVACAVFFGWFALAGARTDVRRRMRSALRWATAIGGVAFFVGGFLPCAAGWGGNLCWILGVFATGPLGFAVGLLLGWLMPDPTPRVLSALTWAIAFEILLPLAGLLVMLALPGEPGERWEPALLLLMPIGIALGMLLGWRKPHLLRPPPPGAIGPLV
jgi:hypothetical protein